MQKTIINLWQGNTAEVQILYLDSSNKYLDKLKVWKQVNTKGASITNLLHNSLHGATLV